ncbi:MAG: hypothetical protein A2Y07_04320 [Planctomycetes bacterium GWF2_50_10]|nr:MAG: hypothetical protein A2Y07_04320 [Planctomycetes bacterium GWF2_50_10]
MIYAGIDAGSRVNKIVLMDSQFNIMTKGQCKNGIGNESIVMELLKDLTIRADITSSHISYIVATGYGRNNIPAADERITEITCHAAGVHHLVPATQAIIDIGGQDSKFIRLGTNGCVMDFAMNDRCAAGTGCFLEMCASKLNIDLLHMGQFATESTSPASISSMCMVFAETEIIGLLTQNTPPMDIIAGVQNSIATRVSAMAGMNIQGPIVFTGGVALLDGMAEALSQVFKQPVQVSPLAQYTGAIGAAILAKRIFEKQK